MGIPLVSSPSTSNKVRSMHYDFKQKLNKIDSQQYRNLRVPEIDWKLNEAENLFIKMIAHPRLFKGLSFELNQRTVDDLRPLIINNAEMVAVGGAHDTYSATLPSNYLTHLSTYANLVKGDCTARARVTLIQHDDKAEESPFDKGSFEWREVNGIITNQKIMMNTGGDFRVASVCMDYIRIPNYFHSAVDAVGGTYNLPDGTVLSSYQNCELPEILHSEIVDLAVLITTGDLFASYQAKQTKLQITN